MNQSTKKSQIWLYPIVMFIIGFPLLGPGFAFAGSVLVWLAQGNQLRISQKIPIAGRMDPWIFGAISCLVIFGLEAALLGFFSWYVPRVMSS